MKINILDFFMAALQIAFIVLKICGVINWSWLVVLIPIILFVVINIAAHPNGIYISLFTKKAVRHYPIAQQTRL